MDTNYRTIVLVSDGTENSLIAEETAANLALASGATVRVVDTLRPPSLFSNWIDSGVGDAFEKLVEYKKVSLEHAADRLREKGVTAETRVLRGHSSAQIASDVMAHEADLLVRYKKGNASTSPGQFGKTAKKLMQACPCPILFVGDVPLKAPHVLACVTPEHPLEENLNILNESRRLGPEEAPSLLYCWKFFGGEMYQEYVGAEGLAETEKRAAEIHQGLFGKLLDSLQRQAGEATVHLVQGDPVEAIPATTSKIDANVVAMSSGSLNHPMHRFLGSTVESVLETVPCAILIVKPEGYHHHDAPAANRAALPS